MVLKPVYNKASGLKISIIAILLCFLIVLLFPVRIKVNEVITTGKLRVIQLLEERLDHKISYSSISPSILHAFEIRDFTILSNQRDEEPLLRIEKLRLGFNLFKLEIDNPLAAFRGLLIVNSELFINNQFKSELIEVVSSFSQSESNSTTDKPALMLPENFNIRGRNIKFSISTETIEADLSRIFFNIVRTQENDLQLSLKSDAVAQLKKLPADLPFSEINADSNIRINGRIDSEFQWADLNVHLKGLDTNIISIDRIGLNIKYEPPGIVKIVKTGDNIPADININLDLSAGNLSAGLQAQDFVFNRYFETGDFLIGYYDLLDASISGQAELKYLIGEKDLEYSGNLVVLNIKGLIESPVDAAVELYGKNTFLTVNKSAISSAPGEINFSGTIDLSRSLPLVNGYLNIPGISYNDINLRSSLRLKSSIENGYILNASNTILNGIDIPGLSARFIPYDDNIEYYLSADIASDESTAEKIYSEGIIQTGEDYYIQTSVDIKNLLVAPVISALPFELSLPEALDNIELSTEMFISGSLEQLSFASPLISLRDRNISNRSLSFSLSGNNSGIRLSDLDLKWDDYYLTGRLSSVLSENGSLVLQTSLDVNGSAFKVGGVYSRDGNLALTGDYNFKLNIFSIGNANNFSLNTDRLPLNMKDSTAFLSLNINGFLFSMDNWKMLINDITIESIPTGFDNGNISLAAVLSQNGGNIFRLDYSDSRSSLKGGGSLSLTDILPMPSGILQLNTSSVETGEQYSLIAGFNGSDIQGDIRFTDFPIKRALNSPSLEGEITGRLSADGPLSSPRISVNLETGNASLNGQSMDISASMLYENLILSLEDISISVGDYVTDDVNGILNLEEGTHSIGGKLATGDGMLDLDAQFTLEAQTSPVKSINEFTSALDEDLKAHLIVEEIIFNGEAHEAWNFDIARTDELINITGGIENEITANYYGNGYFSLEAENPFPVSISASGTILEGDINAEISSVSYTVEDLSFSIISFYEGSFNGRLRLQGPINDPDFYGQLDFHDVVFNPPFVEDISEPFNTSFFFSGKELTVPATRVKTNNGRAIVTIDAVMERWLPRNYELKINVPQGESISSIFYWSPFYVKGMAEGNIRLSGDFSQMNIDGLIMVSEGIFMLNDSIQGIKSTGNPFDVITADLALVSKENNQFLWPNRDFPIVEGYLSTGSELSLQYETGKGINLDGDLSLKGGEIFYFERNFYLKEGVIGFNNESQPGIDPLLSARAEIRDINAEGEMTKIYLIIDPSPLSSFTPRFESDPPLSTAEIIAIIGGNIFDSFTSITDAGLQAVDVFTQLTIMQSIEDGLKSTLGLDLLSIRSSFLSNFLENIGPASSGRENNINFAEYLDNTTLYLGKYFSDDIFLQGMFQFDLYNDTGYSEDLNINVDSEIKLEWEGPVANVELNFYPDFYDPIEGLNKTSLGLSWRFSY